MQDLVLLANMFLKHYFPQKTLFENILTNQIFFWKNVSYDIKSKRIFNHNYKTPNKYYGNRVKGIEYILIEFYKDIVVISKNKEQLKLIGYNLIEEKMFVKWSSNKLTKPSSNLKKDITILNLLKEKLQKHFNSLGLRVRIIYRTTAKSFGSESPDNLLPKKFNVNSVTVFLNFKNFDLNENNLEEVIAFKDLEAKSFTLIPHPKLHKAKIDISKIPPKYRFTNIDGNK